MAKPKGYSISASIEQNSINLLSHLLSNGLIITNIYKNDKTPNHDGHVEVIDETGGMVARLQVQVKNMNANNGMKYSVEISFLAFCNTNLLPTLILLVDTKNEVAYWQNIDEDIIQKHLNSKAKTFTLHFNESQKIIKGDTAYVQQWKNFYTIRLQKQLNYATLEQEKKSFQKRFNSIKKLTDKSYLKMDENFVSIHSFLDYYNYLLEHDFKSIKQLYYEGIWKLGIAIWEYSDLRLDYEVYPIHYNTNDTLIKILDIDNKKRIQEQTIGIIGRYGENPIKNNPHKYAYERIEKTTLETIEKKYLSFTHPFILQEILIEFIDDFYFFLGVTPGLEKYEIKKIIHAFKNFLPIILEELGILSKRLGINHAILEGHIGWIPTIALREATKKARIRLKGIELIDFDYSLESTDYNLRHIDLYLSLLDSSGFTYIKRQYPIVTVRRIRTLIGTKDKSEETVNQYLETIYKNFPLVYDSFIKTHFPNLYNELKYYNNCNRVIIMYGKDFDPSFVVDGSFEIIELRLKNLDNPNEAITEIFSNNDPLLPVTKREMMFREKSIRIGKYNYKVASMRVQGDDFLFERKPLHTMIYKLLEKRFKEYFETKKETIN